MQYAAAVGNTDAMIFLIEKYGANPRCKGKVSFKYVYAIYHFVVILFLCLSFFFIWLVFGNKPLGHLFLILCFRSPTCTAMSHHLNFVIIFGIMQVVTIVLSSQFIMIIKKLQTNLH